MSSLDKVERILHLINKYSFLFLLANMEDHKILLKELKVLVQLSIDSLYQWIEKEDNDDDFIMVRRTRRNMLVPSRVVKLIKFLKNQSYKDSITSQYGDQEHWSPLP